MPLLQKCEKSDGNKKNGENMEEDYNDSTERDKGIKYGQ